MWRTVSVMVFIFLMIRRPPRSTPFPYTPLFRSTTNIGPEGEPAIKSGRQEPTRGLSRSEEQTSELQSPCNLVCRLLLVKTHIYCSEAVFVDGMTWLVPRVVDEEFR